AGTRPRFTARRAAVESASARVLDIAHGIGWNRVYDRVAPGLLEFSKRVARACISLNSHFIATEWLPALEAAVLASVAETAEASSLDSLTAFAECLPVKLAERR